jgi:Zn-dependent protease
MIGLAATAWGTFRPPETELAGKILGQIVFVNLWWGLVNLLPILPLDGGQVLRAVLHWKMWGEGERTARVVSVVTAGALALFAFVGLGDEYGGIFFGFFAVHNVMALRSGTMVGA